MKTVDLSKSLTGHVVLWAKGWYSQGLPITLERLNEVMVEYSALPKNFQLGMKQATDLIAEAATEIGVTPKEIADSFLRRAATTTTYTDKVTVQTFLWSMVGVIGAAYTNNSKIKVKLPALLPGMKKRYDLDSKGDRERQIDAT